MKVLQTNYGFYLTHECENIKNISTFHNYEAQYTGGKKTTINVH